MSGKIAAALAMPIVVAATVGAILVSTRHTALPPLTTSTAVQKTATCMSKVQRFAGIAVANQSSQFDPVAYREFAMPSGGLFEFYNSFPRKFDSAGAEHAAQLQAIPLIQLNPGKRHEQVIKQISTGVYDKQITQYADDVRSFTSCVVISFGHEMNGWWYHWGGPWTTPATFIKAWRRVHNIFTAQHATNVIWSFDPSHQYDRVGAGKVGSPAGKWYPGSKYVDIIGLDGYLGHDKNGHVQSFREIFGYQLADIKKFAPRKPVYLAETGVSPGPDAITQIGYLFSGIMANHLAGLVWFDALAKHDYRLGINVAEDSAYKTNLAGFLRKP